MRPAITMHKSLLILVVLPLLAHCASPEQASLVSSGKPIMNGELDTNPDHGAVVALLTGYSLCSGTLIMDDLVVSAAHCVEGVSTADLRIYFGNNLETDPGEFRSVKWIEVHPDWNPSLLTGDISLIKLASKAPANIKPIPALPAELKLTEADVGTTIEFSGFGKTEDDVTGIKMHVHNEIELVCPGPDACFLGFNRVAAKALAYLQPKPEGGPCSGDSGGPAFIVRDGVEYVTGATSYGDQTCATFGVSTDISAYADWIASTQIEEDCSNQIDDDSDGKIDCLDSECAGFPDCPTACEEAPALSCGQTVTGSTEGGTIMFATYACLTSAEWRGPEVAYQLDIPEGSSVSLDLTMNSGDLDIFVLPADCDPEACIDASTNEPGQPEQLDFNVPAGGAMLLIDTWDHTTEFSLEIQCLGGENCLNGTDDDDDGAIDCQDSDCANHDACVAHEDICDDGLDNDEDGLLDCQDPDCFAEPGCAQQDSCTQAKVITCGTTIAGHTTHGHDRFNVNSCLTANAVEEGPELAYQIEAPTGTKMTALLKIDKQAIGSDLDFFLLAAGAESCDVDQCLASSGNPNQQDERLEFAMPATGAYLLVETWTANKPSAFEIELLCDTATNPNEDCINEVDDDQDGDIDCDDSDCASDPACQETGGEDCGNGLDDDQDGDIDCADSDCNADPACQSNTAEDCVNNRDDDGDGDTDCFDSDCSDRAACQREPDHNDSGGCHTAGGRQSPLGWLLLLAALAFVTRRQSRP